MVAYAYRLAAVKTAVLPAVPFILKIPPQSGTLLFCYLSGSWSLQSLVRKPELGNEERRQELPKKTITLTLTCEGY